MNPRDPDFFNDPYRAYAAIHAASPVFFWEDYGFWCFARHADVSALLRDRRFGRQITHLMSRAELGWPEPKPHLEPFDALERHSILELEPPEHTRLRNLVNRAFVSRRIEELGPRIAALAHERIDAFAARGLGRSHRRVRRSHSCRRDRRPARAFRARWGLSSSNGRTGWSRCTSSG